jgi:hypothetical protein
VAVDLKTFTDIKAEAQLIADRILGAQRDSVVLL